MTQNIKIKKCKNLKWYFSRFAIAFLFIECSVSIVSIFLHSKYQDKLTTEAINRDFKRIFELHHEALIGNIIAHNIEIQKEYIKEVAQAEGISLFLYTGNSELSFVQAKHYDKSVDERFDLVYAGNNFGSIRIVKYYSPMFRNYLNTLSGIILFQLILVVFMTMLLFAWMNKSFLKPFTSLLNNNSADLVSDIELPSYVPMEVVELKNHLLKEWSDRNIATKNAAIARTTEMLAHDVRKPFSMLDVIVSQLEKVNNVSEMRKIIEKTKPLFQQSYAMTLGIINDIMEIGKNQQPIQSPTSLDSVILPVLNEVFRIHNTVDIKLEYRLQHKHKLFVEATKINRVYSNIVYNAIEVMKKSHGDTLWFSSEEVMLDGSSFVKLGVGNNGPGIPEAELQQIFESFFSKKEGGTGLGMAIAKKVVTAHGGTIWCESCAQVSRVEFFFTLPMSSIDEEYAKEFPISSKAIIEGHKIVLEKTEKMQENIINDPREESAMAKLEHVVNNIGRKMKLAIIDDDEIYRFGIANLLIDSRLADCIDLKMFHNGHEILNCNEDIDGYICDIDTGQNSPNGYEITRTLRSRGINKGICIHSNRSLKEDIELSFQSGADQCLPKPMSRAHLLTFLQSFVLNHFQDETKNIAQKNQLSKTKKVVVLDDSKIFLANWERLLSAENIPCETFEVPEIFLEKITKNPAYLNNILAIITDQHFDYRSNYSGLKLGAELKAMNVKLPIYLSSNGIFDQESLINKVDFVIQKEGCKWSEIEKVVTMSAQ